MRGSIFTLCVLCLCLRRSSAKIGEPTQCRAAVHGGCAVLCLFCDLLSFKVVCAEYKSGRKRKCAV